MKIKIILTQKAFDQAFNKQVYENQIASKSDIFCYHLFKIIAIDFQGLSYGESAFNGWIKELWGWFWGIYKKETKGGIKIKSSDTYDTLLTSMQNRQSVEGFLADLESEYDNQVIKDVLKNETSQQIYNKIEMFLDNNFKTFWINAFDNKKIMEYSKLKNDFDEIMKKLRNLFN